MRNLIPTAKDTKRAKESPNDVSENAFANLRALYALGGDMALAQQKLTSIAPEALPFLHCNKVMLLPYYIAAMNIEHAYYELTSHYAPFDGNPLYAAWQRKENDNNKNHNYPIPDCGVSETDAKASAITNKNVRSDASMNACRWASD